MTFHGDYSDSAMVSDKWYIFRDLGYPQLDVQFFEDAEWAILEYYNAPLVPSLTKWKWVYKGFRNIEFNESFAKKLIRQIDPQYPEFWANEIIKSENIVKEKIKRANFEEEWVENMAPKFLKNEVLMERVARYGARELDPARIALAIAKQSPATARSLGIRIDNEHVATGKRETLC